MLCEHGPRVVNATKKQPPTDLRQNLPARRRHTLFGHSNRTVAQDADLAVTDTGTRSVEHARLVDDGLAGRNPMLLLRLSGLLSLRFAERQFAALLFQLPPRMTRFSEPVGTRALYLYCYSSAVFISLLRKPRVGARSM